MMMTCDRCSVRPTCPRAGASPTNYPAKRPGVFYCRLVGGFGRQPIDKSILSPESLERCLKDGPCLTIAEVPTIDVANNNVYSEIVKIFAPPVLSEREQGIPVLNPVVPRSPGG